MGIRGPAESINLVICLKAVDEADLLDTPDSHALLGALESLVLEKVSSRQEPKAFFKKPVSFSVLVSR